MSLLGKLSRSLFKAASTTNTINIFLSGNPNRIVRHLIRKRMYKATSGIGRYKGGRKRAGDVR